MSHSSRLPVLDGWRCLSICLVLGAHLLPLGPSSLKLNGTAGLIGMSLFFALSGFLITSTLITGTNTRDFLIRRGARILPLATLYILICGFLYKASATTYLVHLAYLENYLHSYFLPATGHLWSLCVEVHFYLSIALIAFLFRGSLRFVIPLAYLLLLGNKVIQGVPQTIETHFRVDEILAGGCLALIHHDQLPQVLRTMVTRTPLIFWVTGMFLGGAEFVPGVMFVRCLFACGAIGHTLWTDADDHWRILKSRPCQYIAHVSYAVYLWHGLFSHGWLGSGSTMVKYSKRPLVFFLTFLTSHITTNYFEMPINRWARRFTSRKTDASTTSPANSPETS